ncbi:hypothetical protein Zmor_010941 [Zophobas morio]|uniref:Uncharacterized protein n=1 Tax=Zophobas morio TaxID=2755281 RepID=A0AA38MJ68_9CUCU|nr:hypothetical protein Zmor_010941 [Zophobas morio]
MNSNTYFFVRSYQSKLSSSVAFLEKVVIFTPHNEVESASERHLSVIDSSSPARGAKKFGSPDHAMSCTCWHAYSAEYVSLTYRNALSIVCLGVFLRRLVSAVVLPNYVVEGLKILW